MGSNVYIIGAGMTKFGKYLDKGIKTLAGEALELVLRDCRLAREDIQAAWFSNSAWGTIGMQGSIRGQVALSANGLEGIPIINVENACAGGSTALHSAWAAVRADLFDCVLAIGAEKLYDTDRMKVMQLFMTGTDTEEIFDRLSEMQREAGEISGETPPAGGHSAFMDLYAAGCRRHMKKYGTTRRQLAVIASKSHCNSTLNPLAQYTFPVTVDQALEDRLVAYPLTRSMCAPIGDGAAAAILCSDNYLKKRGSGRAVLIRASVLKSGRREGESDICKRSSTAAYEMAGVGPAEINVAEVHDATVFGELYQTEQMGFCPEGEGGPFAESGATALSGKIPVNPSGGLISRGHPIGASGLAQIYELVTQLRGEAGQRQVKSPRIALAENGGGFLGNGEAAMAVHILEKSSKS